MLIIQSSFHGIDKKSNIPSEVMIKYIIYFLILLIITKLDTYTLYLLSLEVFLAISIFFVSSILYSNLKLPMSFILINLSKQQSSQTAIKTPVLIIIQIRTLEDNKMEQCVSNQHVNNFMNIGI